MERRKDKKETKGKMPYKITWPECGSSNVKQKKQKPSVGPGGDNYGWDLQEEEDIYYYECLDCGNEIYESDLE